MSSTGKKIELGPLPIITACTGCSRTFGHNDIQMFLEIRNAYVSDPGKTIAKYGFPTTVPSGAKGDPADRYAAGSGDAFALDHIGYTDMCCRNLVLVHFR